MAKPNILFLIPDQLRADWVEGGRKLPIKLPNLDHLLDRGTEFRSAICPSPLCGPSRACLAMGCNYDDSPVKSNNDDLPDGSKTFYAGLRDEGYRVMGCGKLDLNKGSCTRNEQAWGLDGKKHLTEWGFTAGVNCEGKIDGIRSGRDCPNGPYMYYLESLGLRAAHVQDLESRRVESVAPTPLPGDAYCDNWIARQGLALLDETPVGQPWFLQVNFAGPHSPWDVTAEMADWYRDAEFPVPGQLGRLTQSEHQNIRRCYAAMIDNIDRWLGEFLKNIDARGESEQTLVVFSSDHGEMLGDRDKWGKSVPWHPALRVPLVVAGPDVRSQSRILDPVSVMDLAATFLDYAGSGKSSWNQSQSLRRLLEGEDGNQEPRVSGLGSWRCTFDGRFKRIEGFGDDPLCFDLESDPGELRNLALKFPGRDATADSLTLP